MIRKEEGPVGDSRAQIPEEVIGHLGYNHIVQTFLQKLR